MDHTSTLTGLQKALKGARTVGGLDVIYTKLAVDLQNLTDDNASRVIDGCLNVMCESTESDAVMFARFDEAGETIASVEFARADFCACNPDKLVNEQLTDWPWVRSDGHHLRLLEILDTAEPQAAAAEDAARLGAQSIGSALILCLGVNGRIAGFLAFLDGQPREEWDADHKLLLKLLGSSLASGLERMEIQADVADREELR
ncbi:MAG: hypothetical protein HKN56_08295, partial [Gammaproteobacteria bacterium]|nr:hypothetical protein [Gammaproteobacteria bacterium]